MERHSGFLSPDYARIGSVTEPLNTTNGDMTVTRLSIGNVILAAGTGLLTNITGTLTDTSGTSRAIYINPTVTPASNSSATFQLFAIDGIWNPSAGVTQTAIQSFSTQTRIRGTGLVGTLQGIVSTGMILDGSSGATTQATNVYGVDARVYGRTSGTSTAAITTGVGFDTNSLAASAGLTITSLIGFRMQNPAANTIQNLIGLDIAALTRASTLNIGIRVAAPTSATSNYAIQLSDTGGTAAGGLTFGTDTNLYRSAADTLKTDDKLFVVGELELDGALNHDGTTVGFYGVTPVVRPTALTAANAGTLNTGDATSDTIIGNMRTRINELETKLQSLGLLT